MKSIPEKVISRAELVMGDLDEIVKNLNRRGFKRLYIDGGKTVQSFMEEDMIDELIISTIPIVLGGGIKLFGSLSQPQMYEHVRTEVKLNAIVQSHYRRTATEL